MNVRSPNRHHALHLKPFEGTWALFDVLVVEGSSKQFVFAALRDVKSYDRPSFRFAARVGLSVAVENHISLRRVGGGDEWH